jgi:hypothetical protein
MAHVAELYWHLVQILHELVFGFESSPMALCSFGHESLIIRKGRVYLRKVEWEERLARRLAVLVFFADGDSVTVNL